MALRCFLFSSDEETAARVRQILSDLGVAGEFCPNAVTAVERITNQPFQIVIIDWDNQPEAGLLLSTARERKASERPITLAVVSHDTAVPKALQAGANSILRKPIVPAQAKDTLTTARDLLRAKQDSAASQAQSAPVAPPANLPAAKIQAKEDALRAGEFLVSPPVTPGGQFETEPEKVLPTELLSPEPVKPLKDLEPTGGTVAPAVEEKAAPTPSPTPSGEGRGLDWYLKSRVAARPGQSAGGVRGNPELMGYDEPTEAPTPAGSSSASAPDSTPAAAAPPKPVLPKPTLAPRKDPEPFRPVVQEQQHKKEAELFAYIAEGKQETAYEEPAQAGSFWGKKAIFAALALAGIAIAAAPQAPWHPQLRKSWSDGERALHNWLNPQPVTPAQAPTTHENFARPGDEYKLPVAENIPDATTDPSQIQVVPVVDPTLKKPNDTTGAGQPAGMTPADGSTPQPAQPRPSDGATAPANPPQTSVPPATAPTNNGSPANSSASVTASHAVTPVVTPTVMASNAAPPKIQRPAYVTPQGKVPSSLQSQMVSMTPEASGNKAPEAALPAIEPVQVPEATERALVSEETAIAYPASAKGQQGVVVLDLLIGRDGTVQDAKFLQGSLMFARTAIDSVKQWKFKPYLLNGRPVQVETNLTVKFKPIQ